MPALKVMMGRMDMLVTRFDSGERIVRCSKIWRGEFQACRRGSWTFQELGAPCNTPLVAPSSPHVQYASSTPISVSARVCPQTHRNHSKRLMLASGNAQLHRIDVGVRSSIEHADDFRTSRRDVCYPRGDAADQEEVRQGRPRDPAPLAEGQEVVPGRGRGPAAQGW